MDTQRHPAQEHPCQARADKTSHISYRATSRWRLDPGREHHSKAAFKLGNRHFTENDTGAAVRWYERAAKAGHTGAQYNLGLIYLKGEGVRWDGFEGIKWIRKAARGGDEQARALLQRIDAALVPLGH